MKRWLKKHGKWLVVGIGILFIGNSIWNIYTATEEWKAFLHAGLLAIWIIITLLVSGTLCMIFRWWDKE